MAIEKPVTDRLTLLAEAFGEDRNRAFQAGTTDLVCKPLDRTELLARVRANRRRARALGEPGTPVTRFGTIEFDPAARLVRRDGVEIHLTPIEYRLLSILVSNAGRVLTHRQLMQAVWGPAYAEQTHHLRVHMGNLRQKLEADPAQPRHLRTETGVGYRLVCEA